MGEEKAASPLSVFRGRRMRSTLFLLAVLSALTALAWLALVLPAASMDLSMVPGHGDTPLFLAMWTVMMVAMMLPAAAPMVQAFVNLTIEKSSGSKWLTLPAALFVGSYLGVWSLFGLAAWLFHGAILGTFPSMAMGSGQGPAVAGGALLLAGLYQFTPLKTTCLTACRSPIDLLATRWRPGPGGALSLGLFHAAYCVGCCWAYFVALFAVGLASIPWMALLTGIIFVEKAMPHGLRTRVFVGLLLAVLGGSFILHPSWGSLVLGGG